ncbi:hypothetical protein NA57DRAFT_57836 [Rhizodiscina lignyota]|uniref:Uncharacterized protein n=1 Tax=Rhizodiscina lignyota TaxID=1504668 RepID=A0A9P4M8X2_9PEZI|nr:hypothetical protein NA57DRAFT_57836 [Rhizodiscina lignyota]
MQILSMLSAAMAMFALTEAVPSTKLPKHCTTGKYHCGAVGKHEAVYQCVGFGTVPWIPINTCPGKCHCHDSDLLKSASSMSASNDEGDQSVPRSGMNDVTSFPVSPYW